MSSNAQNLSPVAKNPASTGDPELDWIAKHHKRQTIGKNGRDGRFEKLMRFMRLQVSVTSTILDLMHEFDLIDHSEYPMLTEEDSNGDSDDNQDIVQHAQKPMFSPPSQILKSNSSALMMGNPLSSQR